MARVRSTGRPLKVLVLGATGNVGGRTAIDLFRSGEVERLRVAGRSREAASAFASRFSAQSTTAVVGEAIDIAAPDLAQHLAGEDVVVNCAGPGYALEEHAVRGAIEAGADYVSLCDDHTGTDRALAQDAAAKEADISVISGCGLSPGITSFLIEAAAEELDEVRGVQVAVGASSADSEGRASAQHLLYALSQQAPFLSEGALASEKAGTAPRLVYFPEPVGWVETFLCGHPEVSTVPRHREAIETIQFRIGLTERIVMDMMRGSRASGLLRSELTRKMWLAASWPSRGVFEKLPPRGPAWTAARVDIHGVQNGTSSIVSLAVVDHLVNLASVTIKEAALALGRGEAKAKGVGGPEGMLDSGEMLRKLSQRGIRAARLESEMV